MRFLHLFLLFVVDQNGYCVLRGIHKKLHDDMMNLIKTYILSTTSYLVSSTNWP